MDFRKKLKYLDYFENNYFLIKELKKIHKNSIIINYRDFFYKKYKFLIFHVKSDNNYIEFDIYLEEEGKEGEEVEEVEEGEEGEEGDNVIFLNKIFINFIKNDKYFTFKKSCNENFLKNCMMNYYYVCLDFIESYFIKVIEKKTSYKLNN